MELILRRQKKPYFFPYLFQGLNDVIMSWKFTGIIFLEGRRPRSEGCKQTEVGGPKEGGPHGPVLGHMGPLIWALEAPLPSIFVPVASSWPKTDYKNSPSTSFERRRRRNTKPETERQKAAAGEDRRGETPPESTSGGLHPPPTWSSSTSTARSSSSLHCKLLANMMYDAIYFSHDLLCLSIYVWEVICLWQ